MAVENRSVLLRCNRCSKQVPMSELKYGNDGKLLLCDTCRGAKPAALREVKSTMVQSSESERTHYLCTSCHYKFSRATITPKKCPYCGKEGTVVTDKSLTGRSLLDEV